MANNPPPYSDITGISRAVMKDNAQGNNSIVLNATGTYLNATVANTLTVAPIRTIVNGSLPAGFLIWHTTQQLKRSFTGHNNINNSKETKSW